jgi:uncharacterized protein
MEDILSSIKRIISEDSEAALSGPRVKRSVGLSPMLRAEPAEVPEEDEILELTNPVAVEEPVVPQPTRNVVHPDEPKETLVSPTTAQISRSSLAALSAMIVKPDVPGSDTLEGLVRDMLKPMLADWLDTHLPEIVERQVAREIRRISERD